jgi:flagellar biosynthesis/type III secretory pathway chaperone
MIRQLFICDPTTQSLSKCRKSQEKLAGRTGQVLKSLIQETKYNNNHNNIANSVEQKSFREIYNGEYKKSSFYGTGRFITMLTKSLTLNSLLCH